MVLNTEEKTYHHVQDDSYSQNVNGKKTNLAETNQLSSKNYMIDKKNGNQLKSNIKQNESSHVDSDSSNFTAEISNVKQSIKKYFCHGISYPSDGDGGKQCKRSCNDSLLNKGKLETKKDDSNHEVTGQIKCKFCGKELHTFAIPSFTFDLDTLLSRLKKMVMASLTSAMPDWLSEPEFMVYPKPQVDKTLIHSHADSLFSTSSGFTNYYGILNLCLILLVLGNARLFLENIIKYGILINYGYLTDWFLREPYNWPNLLLTVSIAIFPAIALLTEKLLAQGKISNRVGVIIYIINLGVLLLFPAAVIYYLHPIIVFSIFTLGNVTICFLKLISYAHVNYWCRENYSAKKLKRRSSSGNVIENQSANNVGETYQTYPNNINVKDLAYFMFAPTLCYELNFPRSARIRKRFLAKRIIEMVFLSWLMLALMQQWIVPAVNNARQPLAEMEIFKMVERLLKLAIPNHLIWLIWFYCFFHSTLNVVAELLRFGDRVFYKDWWNAETVSEFWQHWNIPVHRFATRHIYKPLLNRGFSRLMASTIVFLLSAFFHEYLVSVPLRMFKIWAFMGMAMQVPIAYITSKFVRGKWGNITMWLSLILGQPVAILAYFHDYYVVHSLPLHTNHTEANVF